MPPGQMPKIERDGKFHEVMPAGAIPGVAAVQAAVKDKALVVAVGPRSLMAAERALEVHGPSPIFFLSYDYGRFMSLMAQNGMMPGVSEKLLGLFGHTTMSATVNDQGFAMAFDMELKKK
jgi:hypothetical protein